MGRARRRSSVIVAEKIDVHVHAIGVFSKLARMVSKSSLSSVILLETVILGVSKRGKKMPFLWTSIDIIFEKYIKLDEGWITGSRVMVPSRYNR